MRLICMRGYPGSGKSTIAKTLGGAIVCRDDLRMQMFGTYRPGPDGEDAVTVAEKAIVKSLLRDQRDVVIDAMHVNPSYLRQWAKVAREAGADFVVHDVCTPVDECVKRDVDRWIDGGDRYVTADVIRKIAKRFPMDRWPNVTPLPDIVCIPYVPPLGKPPAIIVDLDGTLAYNDGHRSFYDYTKVIDDHLDLAVGNLVKLEYQTGTHVIICSGRDSSCYNDTKDWLRKYKIPFDSLLMRPEGAVDNYGNKLPDWIVKLDLFDTYIRGKYNIKYVLDDRNQVVELWRKLGLKCLQVEPGDF